MNTGTSYKYNVSNIDEYCRRNQHIRLKSGPALIVITRINFYALSKVNVYNY